MIREIGVALVTHDCKPRASGDDPRGGGAGDGLHQ